MSLIGLRLVLVACCTCSLTPNLHRSDTVHVQDLMMTQAIGPSILALKALHMFVKNMESKGFFNLTSS